MLIENNLFPLINNLFNKMLLHKQYFASKYKIFEQILAKTLV